MNNVLFALDAAGLTSGQAFLESELEKRDALIKTPLPSFTYGEVTAVEAESSPGNAFSKITSSVTLLTKEGVICTE